MRALQNSLEKQVFYLFKNKFIVTTLQGQELLHIHSSIKGFKELCIKTNIESVHITVKKGPINMYKKKGYCYSGVRLPFIT